MSIRLTCSWLAVLILCCSAVALAAEKRAFEALQVIDQWNLRQLRAADAGALPQQVARIKGNMDAFSKLGFSEYVLFQKESFQEHLTWGGKHTPDGPFRHAVREVIELGKARGMKVFLHSDAFTWPAGVGVAYGDTPEAWAVHTNAIKELIALYPDLGGLGVTADEGGGVLKTREGVLRLHNETARALVSDGRPRLALMRTWQRVDDLLGSPAALGEGDDANILFTIKNVSGDFNLISGFDAKFIDAVKRPDCLIVEFDAWREFETHNLFPLYMGDEWTPRFKALADRGVKRIAVRINWNTGQFPITDRPWGNWVNIFSFVKLAENPRANPDDILREFVAMHYPPDARAAAFDLYKYTQAYAKALYYPGGKKVADHGRVNRPDKARARLGREYMARVDAEYRLMLTKIESLPPGTPHRDELRKGAIILSWVAQGIGLASGAPGDGRFVEDWRKLDPASFREMRGENVPVSRKKGR